MDKIEQLYNLYRQQGLLSEAITLDMFRQADDLQQQKLYDLGKGTGLFQSTDLSTFQTAWGGLKKKDEPDMESVSEDGLLEPQGLDTKTLQALDEQRLKIAMPEAEYQQLLALEEEKKTLPLISQRSGEVQKEIDRIKSLYQPPKLEEVPVKSSYEINNEQIATIDNEINQISNQYTAIAQEQGLDPNELINTDGQVQYLRDQKQMLQGENALYNEALDEMSKATGSRVGIKNLFNNLLAASPIGAFVDPEATEITEYTDELKNYIVQEIGSDYNLERMAGGRVPLEEKEAIILNAKLSLLDDKSKELKKILADPNATKEEKLAAQNKMAYIMSDVGLDIVGGRFKNQFETSEKAERFKERYSESPIKDTIGSFIDAAAKTIGGYFIGAPAEMMGSVMNLFYKDDVYSPVDKFLDSLRNLTAFNYAPSSQTKGLLIDENGEFDLSLYSGTKGVLQNLPFTLGILMEMKRGKFKMPEGKNIFTKIIGNRKDPAKAYETYKLVTTSYKLALSDAMDQARELGLDATDAALFGNTMALMEGVTGIIMPDTKYFSTQAGKLAARQFVGDLKSATTKQARAAAIKNFFIGIGKEIGEEEAMLFYEDLAKTAALTDHEFMSEFANIANQQQLLTVTIGLSGSLGGIRVPAEIRQGKADIYNDIAKNAETLTQMIEDEIQLFPEKKDDLEKVRTYINNVSEAVNSAPENVTFEQIDLLTQKINLQNEMDKVDDSFKGPYREKIDELNQKIIDAGKSYTVEVTAEEATEALKREGIENPTQQQVIEKTDQLIKEKEDAIQEQKAGVVPPIERATGVPQMEEEVREPVVEEEEETIKDSQIPAKVEIYTYEDANEDNVRVRVITNLDGSRNMQFVDENNRPIGAADRISKNNTLSTEEYVTNKYGDIVSKEDVDLDQTISPKMVDKMSSRQKKAVGIEEVTPIVEEEITTPLTQEEIDQQVSDLETKLKGENPQFQLATSMTSEQKKQGLVEEATKQMEEADQIVSDETVDTQQLSPKAKTYTIEVKDNTELADKVKRMGLSEIIGKKINLVMADQLKVSDKFMGGPFFPLMDKLFGKVAWASMKPAAAMSIVKGAIGSDYSVVFNMNPTAVLSNKAFRNNILDNLSEADQTQVYGLLKEYIGTSKKKKWKEAMAKSKTLTEFFDKMDKFGTSQKIDLLNAILPTQKISPKTGIGKFLKDKGLTMEKLTDDVSEQFVKDLPVGAMTMVLQITDKNGNPVTKETAKEAILTREQQEAEGLPTHPNYPVYIRGKAVGLLNETVPFWEVSKNVFDTINKKVAGVIQKKVSEKKEKVDKKTGKVTPAKPATTRKFSAKEAYNDAYYQGQLSANKVLKLVDPMVSDYMKFVKLISNSFPSVEVVTDQAMFDELLNDVYTKKLSTKNQKIYGAVYKGKLYLNPALENYNTPVHEFGHIWTNTVKELNKQLYDKGISLIEESEYVEQIENSKEYQKVIKKMKEDGATDQEIREYILEEALATAIGDKGESFVTAAQKRGFKNWLNDLFTFIKKLTGISKYTPEQLQNVTLDKFLEGVVVDIMSGNKVFADAQANTLGDALQLMTDKTPNEIDMYSTIQEARQNGFHDSAIKIFLQRQGFKVAEINEAMAVPFDVTTNVPMAFGNVPGGMIKGAELYNNVINKLKAWKKKKANSDKDFGEVRAEAQNILANEAEFKALDDSLQKELLISLDKNLGITKNKQVANDIKNMRAILRDRAKIEKNLNRLKTDLRIFIRKNMPKSMWDNKQVQDFMKAIADANSKNIQVVYTDVVDMITKQNVKEAFGKINKFKQTKTTTIQAGRLKGKMLVEGQERIDRLKNDIALDDKSDPEVIEKKMSELQKEYDKLSSENVLTESQMDRIADIQLAMLYNEALLMDNTNPLKVDTLSEVAENLKQVVIGERSVYKEAMAEATARYNNLKNEFFEDVAGFKVDFNDDASVEEAAERIKKKQNLKDNRPKARKVITNILTKADQFMFMNVEAMEGLLDRISKSVGSMFGGKATELVLDRLDESSNIYKLGKTQMYSVLEENAKRIFGNNFKKITLNNAKPSVKISTIDPKKVSELKEQLKKAKTKQEKNNISRQIDELTNLMSQNQMYYLYNQFKDPANHPGFETKFGKNYMDVMAEIESKLDPKVKEWADWQVDEFFPSVYERYNDVYKEIYRTNMPWNSQYAGRLMREGTNDDDALSMLDQTSSEYRTAIGSASSKLRVKNKKAVMTVDGDNMLARYTDDMEYFRAYAENMRDITKFYNNPLIEKAIVATSGQEVYDVIKGQFDKVLNRKLAADAANTKMMQFFTRGYVLSKLGLNPTIFLKQMTSGLAFADYIGYRNWMQYGANELTKGVGAWNSSWKELYKNSTYLQDRYESKDFSKIIESYNKENLAEVSGGQTTDKVVDFLMYLVKQGDKGGIMGAIPNYSYYKDEYKKNNPKASDQEAIDYAVKKVERQIKTTQQSQDIQDRDFYQTSNVLFRWFSLFTSSVRALLRKEIYSARQLYRKMAGLPSKGTTKENIRTFVTYHVAIPMLFQYVALGLPGILRPWRDDDDDELGAAALLGNLNGLFIVGDVLTSIRDKVLDKPWAGEMRQIPSLALIESIFENYNKYTTAKKPETQDKYFKKLILSIVETTGLPATQAMKWITNLKKVATADIKDFGEAMLRLFNFSDYVIDGEKKKAKSAKRKIGGA